MYETKKKKGTLNSSNVENELYNLLLTKFPKAIHHYESSLYPFDCDFYITELDLYIEYQGTWTHGDGKFHLPFDKNNPEHLKKSK